MSVDRAFGKANTHKPDIKHFSHKLRAMVSCDSHLEEKKCFVVDLDNTVLWYMTQPDSTYFEFENQICRYTPDFLVYTGVYEFWEIKPSRRTLTDKFKNRQKALEQHYENVLKVPLRVVTEEGLTKREFIASCQKLSAYINHYQDADITRHIISDLFKLAAPCVRDAEVIATHYGQSPDYAWSLLANKNLKYDQNLLIDRATPLDMEASHHAL